jgi:transcriptional regulator with XRE-family HTH domain
MSITPEQVKSARKLLRWSQMGLALMAGVNQNTVANFEIGRSRPTERTLSAIRRTLEATGIEFTEGEPDVRRKPAGGGIQAT